MGCCVGKKSSEEQAPLSETTSSSSNSGSTGEQRAPIDRRLLIISDQDGGVVGRLPGQLNGRQFKVYDCKQCTILVLDHTSTITVDNCTGCQIFIAPSKGSVYLRDCVDCQCVVACQQFRMKNGKKCSISLFTATQPVIESSSKIKFACFQCHYPQLETQFKSAGLSEFNNRWSVVHDFDRGAGEENWSLMHDDNPVMIAFPTEGEFAEVGVTFAHENSVVPLTVGLKQKPEGECCLVVFFENKQFHNAALNFAHQLLGKVQLVLTRKVKLQSPEAERLFQDNDTLISMAVKGEAILMEACGDNCVSLCTQLISELSLEEGTWYVSPTLELGRKDSEAFENHTESSFSM